MLRAELDQFDRQFSGMSFVEELLARGRTVPPGYGAKNGVQNGAAVAALPFDFDLHFACSLPRCRYDEDGAAVPTTSTSGWYKWARLILGLKPCVVWQRGLGVTGAGASSPFLS